MLLPQVENSSCVIGEQLFSNEMLMLFLVQVLNINDFIFTQLHKICLNSQRSQRERNREGERGRVVGKGEGECRTKRETHEIKFSSYFLLSNQA